LYVSFISVWTSCAKSFATANFATRSLSDGGLRRRFGDGAGRCRCGRSRSAAARCAAGATQVGGSVAEGSPSKRSSGRTDQLRVARWRLLAAGLGVWAEQKPAAMQGLSRLTYCGRSPRVANAKKPLPPPPSRPARPALRSGTQHPSAAPSSRQMWHAEGCNSDRYLLMREIELEIGSATGGMAIDGATGGMAIPARWPQVTCIYVAGSGV
jgi:hypothetical protein